MISHYLCLKVCCCFAKSAHRLSKVRLYMRSVGHANAHVACSRSFLLWISEESLLYCIHVCIRTDRSMERATCRIRNCIGTTVWLYALPFYCCIRIRIRIRIRHREWDVAQAVEHPPVKVSIIRSILHSGCICSLGYFPFKPVVHNWSIKGCGMCCPVCGKVHIKRSLAAYWKE